MEAAGVEPASGDGATEVSPRSARALLVVKGSPTGRVSHHQPGKVLTPTPSRQESEGQPANYDASGSPNGQGEPRRGRQLSGHCIGRFGTCRTRLFNEVADLGVLPPPPSHPRRNRIAPLSKIGGK